MTVIPNFKVKLLHLFWDVTGRNKYTCRDVHNGQVITSFESKQIFIATQKIPATYVLSMSNGPACAMSKRLERAISYMWLWLAPIPQQSWRESGKQNTKLLLKRFVTERNKMGETI